MERNVGLKKLVQDMLDDSENEDFVPSDEDLNDPPFNIHSEKRPSSSSDEVSDQEEGPVYLLMKSGSKVPIKVLGESNFDPENYESILMDDSDAEDITNNEEMELEYSNTNHENNPAMILGTMYNEEVVENNSSTVNEIGENLCQSDDVLMEENINEIADKHTEKHLKLGQQSLSGRYTGTPRGKVTPRGKGIPRVTGSSRDKETPGGIETPRSNETPGGIETPRDKETPEGTVTPRGNVTPRGTGTPRGNVTPRGKGTPRVTGTPRSKGSARGKRTPRATFRRRLSFTESQWKRGDKLNELYVTDEDVPDELREMITQIAQSREYYRTQRVKKNRTSEEEEEEDGNGDDGEDELLFAGAAHTARFEWSSMADYSGKREEFLPEVIGPAHAFENAYGAFRHFWDDDILAHIVKETNRYAEELCHSYPAFAQEWYETNIHEILILFAFWMMLGILRMPTIKSCFTTNPMLQVNIFRHMFSKNRYITLQRAFTLKFNGHTDESNLKHCFGPILDHLNSRFRESYIPSQNICIDESLLLWKGRLTFRQLIRTKSARCGVKTFEVCESKTGYLWSFFIYLGANTVYDPDFPPTLLKSTATVLTLVKPLLDKGYTLYLDNWFNSPLLARYLKSRKTDCVGTLRANRRNVPPIIPLCHLRDGEFVARHSDNVVVMAYQDKNHKVTMISTFHGTEQNCKNNVYKPQAVLDYNKSMGGVDRKDQMLEPYLLERKRCGKWYLKFFKRLLNCSILNSRILLKGTGADLDRQLAFRLELVEQVLLHHLQKVPKPKPIGATSRTIGRDTTAEKHWPRQIETILSNGRRSRRRCVWCTQNKINRRTTMVCSECDVPLCVQPCFKEYHNHHSSLSPSQARIAKSKKPGLGAF